MMKFLIKNSTIEVEINFGKNEVLYPEQNLFLWGLLLNRIDIATLFWQIGEVKVCFLYSIQLCFIMFYMRLKKCLASNMQRSFCFQST
jgi:hypothetical protein